MDSFHLTHNFSPPQPARLPVSSHTRTLPSMTFMIQPTALPHFFPGPSTHIPVSHLNPSATASALDSFLSSAALTTDRYQESITDLLSQLRDAITLSMEIDSDTSQSLQAT